jgi:hypothetical protein
MEPTKKTITVGRPPKFDEPSSPVTVTLPSRILDELEKVDSDRGKAIVKCVEGMATTCLHNKKRIEIIKISDDAGMIVIGPCRCLESVPWLRLVEIAPGRFLLSMPTGTNVTSLEVAIMDLIENQAAENDYEKGLLEELRQCIAHHRRQEIVTKGEVLFVDLNTLKRKLRSWSFFIPLPAGIEWLQFLSDSVHEGMILTSCFC